MTTRTRSRITRFFLTFLGIWGIVSIGSLLFAQGIGTGGPALQAFYRVRSLAIRTLVPDGSDAQPDVNPRGALIVTQDLPPLAELVRGGTSYVYITSTGVAAVNAVPTTASQLTMWNNESDAGRAYVIDSVAGVVTTAATNSGALSIAVMLNMNPQARPGGALGTTGSANISTLNGKPYSGKAQFWPSLTVTNDNWTVLGCNQAGNMTGMLGTVCDVPINGLYIVPPRHIFNLAALYSSVAGGPTVKLQVRWHEVQLPVQN